MKSYIHKTDKDYIIVKKISIFHYIKDVWYCQFVRFVSQIPKNCYLVNIIFR